MRKIFFILIIGFSRCKEPIAVKPIIPVEQAILPRNVMLTDLNNQPISLDQFKGKTIFINFWATWCKPCIQEMPSIKNLQELLNKQEFVFLLASNESPDQIKEFEIDHGYDFNYVRIINMEELGVEALPTTCIFNPTGDLVFSEMGSRKWDDSTNVEMILRLNKKK